MHRVVVNCYAVVPYSDQKCDFEETEVVAVYCCRREVCLSAKTGQETLRSVLAEMRAHRRLNKLCSKALKRNGDGCVETNRGLCAKSAPILSRPVLQALLIVAAGLWIYWPASNGGWVWDDDVLVKDNSNLRNFQGLWEIWLTTHTTDYWPFPRDFSLWLMDPSGGLGPAPAVRICIFLVNLLPVLGLVKMRYLYISWVADHFAYLPMIGLIGLIVVGLKQLHERFSSFGIGTISIAVMVGLLSWDSQGRGASRKQSNNTSRP
jgi:hypothetical protein